VTKSHKIEPAYISKRRTT